MEVTKRIRINQDSLAEYQSEAPRLAGELAWIKDLNQIAIGTGSANINALRRLITLDPAKAAGILQGLEAALNVSNTNRFAVIQDLQNLDSSLILSPLPLLITASGSWTCPKTGNYRFTLVGGGGGGGSSHILCGGGGAGAVRTFTLPITRNSIGSIVIGAGRNSSSGAGGGGETSVSIGFETLTAGGGGGGGGFAMAINGGGGGGGGESGPGNSGGIDSTTSSTGLVGRGRGGDGGGLNAGIGGVAGGSGAGGGSATNGGNGINCTGGRSASLSDSAARGGTSTHSIPGAGTAGNGGNAGGVGGQGRPGCVFIEFMS